MMDTAVKETRVKEMYDFYQSGRSLAEVGAAFDVSRQRVHILFKRAGLPRRDRGTNMISERRLQERRAEIVNTYLATRSMRATAAALHMSALGVRRMLLEEKIHLLHVRDRQARFCKFSSADIQNALRAAAASNLGGNLSQQQYAAYRRKHPSLPSASLVTLRYASWNEAKKQAGLTCAPPRRNSYAQKRKDPACIAASLDLVIHLFKVRGKAPLVSQYNALSSGKVMSSVTLRRLYDGSWLKVLLAAEQRSGQVWSTLH